MIDLRADVTTRAPQGMLQAMANTPCKHEGPNYDDRTATQLENRLAKMFGKEAGLFFPTTVMANLASVLNSTQPGSEVIIWGGSHSVEKELASFVTLGGVQTRQIASQTGTFSVEEVQKLIRSSAMMLTYPSTELVFLENPTFNGRVWDINTLRSIRKMSKERNVRVHIDGARIFNALDHYKCEANELADCFDSMSICLTKGLCCPIGSVVIGSSEFITKLKHIRKSLGGGIWHSGVLCSAGLYALDHLIPQINKDNLMAKKLAKQLSQFEQFILDLSTIDANMIHFSVKANFNHNEFKQHLQSAGIKIKPFDEDKQRYRFVTHMGIRQPQIQKVISSMAAYFKKHN